MKYNLVWNANLLVRQPDAENDQVQLFYNAVKFEELSQLEDVAEMVRQQLLQGLREFVAKEVSNAVTEPISE